jgi:hypothetical protein
MSRTWAVRAAVPLMAVALMIGCSKASRRAEAQRERMGGAKYEIVSLKGCLEKAPGSNEFVLRQVQVPIPSAQLSDASSAHGLTVTDGSWVRLRDGSDQLKGHLGQTVSVTGTILDDGRNTIGTAGKPTAPDEAESPVDASRAAKDESGASRARKEAGPIGQVSQSNGNVPEMAVERVSPTGQPCGTEAPKATGR